MGPALPITVKNALCPLPFSLAGCPASPPQALSTFSSFPISPAPLQGLSSPLLRCPSQRLLDRVVRRYAEVADAGSIFMDHFTDRDKLRLLYTLAVNTHPVLLQVCSDPALESLSREGIHIRL